MKKVFKRLAIEIISFANEDLLAKSVGWDSDGWDGILDNYGISLGGNKQ